MLKTKSFYTVMTINEAFIKVINFMPIISKNFFTVFGDQTVFGLTVFVKYMYSLFLKRNKRFCQP